MLQWFPRATSVGLQRARFPYMCPYIVTSVCAMARVGILYNVAAASMAPAALNFFLFVHCISTLWFHSMYRAQPILAEHMLVTGFCSHGKTQAPVKDYDPKGG